MKILDEIGKELFYDEVVVEGIAYLKDVGYKHYILEALKRNIITSNEVIIKLTNLIL